MPMFVSYTPGNVRISDLGLAVELKEGKTKTKGYAGTPGQSRSREPIRYRRHHILTHTRPLPGSIVFTPWFEPLL